MPPFITHAARHRRRVHQKSWGLILLEQWHELRLRWVRHRQRAALRDLADDPHRLKDVGITRKQAWTRLTNLFGAKGERITLDYYAADVAEGGTRTTASVVSAA
jgi:uncharacterized protein YjiS (DUF1127 family)